ncbi:MFS transporter [Rummeliibacillus sp. SL167]|uniref:MFS transporter n=1 Tax=Rummeliibacillus sp. SL167 TaxID=2579792 RepID=UPI0011B6C5E8|nr:MFS transporter [Rummeliibacillus sp. SL167]
MSIEGKITLIGFLTMFVVGVSDLIVVGIISPMSEAFNVQTSLIGQLVTIYAVSFAVLSPILTKITSRFHDKKTLLISLFIFIIINFLVVFVNSFLLLCILRILLAACASLVTVKLMAIGAKLVAPEKKAKVVSNIYVGFSAANILGVPLGTLLAAHFFWTIPFYLIGLMAIFCLLLIFFFIPSVKPELKENAKQGEYKILDKKGIIIILTFLWLMMVSNSMLFTYLEPIIRDGGHSLTTVSLALFIAGVAGVVGSKLGNLLSEKFGYYMAGSIIVFVYIISLFMLLFYTENIIVVLLGVLLWNLFHWGTNPTVQYALLQFIKGDPSQIFSYNISLLNLGIGIGSFIGGALVLKDPHFILSIVVAIGIAIVSFLILSAIRKNPVK